MQYLILDGETEPKIVGVRDGMGQIKNEPTMFEGKNEWYAKAFLTGVKQPPGEWVRNMTYHHLYAKKPLEDLKIRKNGKLTDFLFLAFGLVFVSDRLKNLLLKFNLPENHDFLSTTFYREGTGEKIEGYWQFVFDRDNGEHTVDFAKSEFDYTYHEETFAKKFSVSSYQDYFDIEIETGRNPEDIKLILNSNFNTQIDFWSPAFLGNHQHYLSARLIAAMNEAKITGARYRSFPNSLFTTDIVFPEA